MGCLFNGKHLNRTVVFHMSMLITNRTHSDGTESSGMSPLSTSETSGNGVSRSQLMTVGTDIKWAILLIVAEIMTLKTFSEGGCRSKMDGDMNNPGWAPPVALPMYPGTVPPQKG